MMEKAPDTLGAKGPNQGARIEQNELIYIANKDEDVDLQLKDNLFEDEAEDKFSQYEAQVLRQKKRRKQRAE